MESCEVLAVRYATRNTRLSEVYLNHHTYGEPDAPIAMDYYFWVIRGGDETVVVDTGFKPSVGKARGRRMICPVPDALSRLGIAPAEVSTVVVTHAHYDHAGNLELFPESTVVIADREISFWTSPLSRRELFAQSVESDDLALLNSLDAEGRVSRVSGTKEIAPGVTAIEVGGHTPGQMMVLVQGDSRSVLLMSDAVHYYDELRRDRPFLVVADLPAMYEAFDTIRAMDTDESLVLIPGHDPLVMEAFAPLDDMEPHLGTRIVV